MVPLSIVESEREGFDQPVVELWRDDEFVGMVFWDGSATIVQIYPAEEDVHDLDLDDLIRTLDTAQQIVDPFAFPQADGIVSLGRSDDDWEEEEEEDPATMDLVTEFDPQAVHRTEDGEGFFPHEVATALIERCDRLGLAVVEMEGFDLLHGELKARPGLIVTIGPPDTPMTFAEFRTMANELAATYLANWPQRDSMVVAFVIQQPDGERIVL
jgi:hypothetical protein